MGSSVVAFGLRPLRTKGSKPYSGGLTQYTIAQGYATAIYQGDMVCVSAGNLEVLTSGNFPGVLGVFMGCAYVDKTTKKPVFSNYYPASTSSYGFIDGSSKTVAYVCDDPDATFLICSDAAVSAGDLGKNVSVSLATGSSYTGLSGMTLKAGTATAGAAALRIVGLHKAADNAWGDTGTMLEVSLALKRDAYVSAR